MAIAVGAPVLTGLVSNIARPGGNITGSTILGTEVAPKRLELAKELRPSATLIVLLLNPDNPANVELERELRVAAPRQGLKLVSVRARHVDDFEAAFGMLERHRPDALLVTGDATHQAHMDRIIAFAARSRIPALYNLKENALAGGLIAYAADHRELSRRAADARSDDPPIAPAARGGPGNRVDATRSIAEFDSVRHCRSDHGQQNTWNPFHLVSDENVLSFLSHDFDLIPSFKDSPAPRHNVIALQHFRHG